MTDPIETKPTATTAIDGVGRTGLLVAALRAVESERPDALFQDPFARALAGDEGFATLERARRSPVQPVPIIEVRTRYIDEQLSTSVAAGIEQVVILAAGMDARAYRMTWPEGTRVYEVDQPQVLARKAAVLEGHKPGCWRRPVAIDLREDWPTAIAKAGFDAGFPTAWLIEGLLMYLTANDVEILFGRLDALSAPASRAFFDLPGQSLLESPYLKDHLSAMARNGSPWLFGTDEPELLLGAHGWTSSKIDPAIVGDRFHRWPIPKEIREAPGFPRSYFVEATKS